MIDQRGFRDVLGHYPTGVVVVTGMAEDEIPLGMVVGTFSAVSLEPPLVSFMPTRSSATYAALRQSPSFCINVLAHDQRMACQTLTTKEPDKFDRVEWTRSAHGLPLIDDAVAHIHCRPSSEIVAGDHLIVVCEVFEVEIARPTTPLLFFQGGYGGFSSSGMTPHLDSSLIAAVRVAEVARPQLERLAMQFDAAVEALIQVNDHDQTIGASAYGDTARIDERLGVRIPLIPPLGEVAVAWSPQHLSGWLDRLPREANPSADDYETHVAAVRASGYGIARIQQGDDEGYKRIVAAIGEYATGTLTPARERAVRAEIASGARYYHSAIDADEEGVDIVSVVVPVFDPTAEAPLNSGLTLRMGSLPQSVSGRTVLQWVAALTDAAMEVSKELAGPARRDFDRYLTSGLRDLH